MTFESRSCKLHDTTKEKKWIIITKNKKLNKIRKITDILEKIKIEMETR